MFDLVVKNGLVVHPTGLRRESIAAASGRISAMIEPGEPVEAYEVVDAQGKLILPGLVDAHVHFREPGLTHKEDFATGSRAAAAGGVTTVMVMPTDNPVTQTSEQFLEKKALAEGRSHVDFALQAAVGPDAGAVKGLTEVGAVSFEVFLGLVGNALRVTTFDRLISILDAVREVGGVLGVTPFDDDLAAITSARAKVAFGESRAAFAPSLPPIVEASGIAKACCAQRLAGGRMHVRQVSSALGVAMLSASAGEGVSAEVTPHNLLLTNETLLRDGAVAKVIPPLRKPTDLAAVREALRSGRIDIVATDHAPHAPDEKAAGTDNIWAAPGGFPGVQTFLPALLILVGDGVITYSDLVRVACEEPARLFGLHPRKGALKPGSDADFVIVDPSRPFPIDDAHQVSKACHSPFHGLVAPATPVLAVLRGEVVMRDGRPEGLPRGRFIAPAS
jgi:dihydroorotase